MSQGVPPENILVMTLTNRAATEFRQRILNLVGENHVPQIYTFHSFTQALLVEYGHLIDFKNDTFIIDDWSKQFALKQVRQRLNMDYTMFMRLAKRALAMKKVAISTISNDDKNDINEENYETVVKEKKNGSQDLPVLKTILRLYNEELSKLGLCDYDDLLIQGHKLLKKYPNLVDQYQTVLVDEMQDINPICWELAKQASNFSSLFAVGDPNQCIYGFIGADASLFDRMKNELPNVETIYLNKNYRSQQMIIDMFRELIVDKTQRQVPIISKRSSLIDGYKKPQIKRFDTRDQENLYVVSRIMSLVESGVRREDIVVLTRSSHTVRDFMSTLLTNGIDSVLVGGATILETKTADLVGTILRACQSPTLDIYIIRLLREHKIFIRPSDLEKALNYANQLGISLIEALRNRMLWIGKSAYGDKILEFLMAYDDLVQNVNESSSVEEVMQHLRIFLVKIEFLKKEKNRLVVQRSEEDMDALFKYWKDCEDVIYYRMEKDQKGLLKSILQTIGFSAITPPPNVSNAMPNYCVKTAN